MRKKSSGPISPVYVVSDSQLVENGGQFSIEGGPARIVYGMSDEEASGHAIIGGSRTPIYLLSDSDLRENGGQFKVEGGPAELVTIVSNGSGVSGFVAQPVYAINLDSWPPSSTVDLQLTWTDNSDNETGFYVQRGPNGSDWTTVATLVANTTQWIDTNVDTGQTLYYRVLAYNDAGNSDPSNTASISV